MHFIIHLFLLFSDTMSDEKKVLVVDFPPTDESEELRSDPVPKVSIIPRNWLCKDTKTSASGQVKSRTQWQSARPLLNRQLHMKNMRCALSPKFLKTTLSDCSAMLVAISLSKKGLFILPHFCRN